MDKDRKSVNNGKSVKRLIPLLFLGLLIIPAFIASKYSTDNRKSAAGRTGSVSVTPFVPSFSLTENFPVTDASAPDGALPSAPQPGLDTDLTPGSDLSNGWRGLEAKEGFVKYSISSFSKDDDGTGSIKIQAEKKGAGITKEITGLDRNKYYRAQAWVFITGSGGARLSTGKFGEDLTGKLNEWVLLKSAPFTKSDRVNLSLTADNPNSVINVDGIMVTEIPPPSIDKLLQSTRKNSKIKRVEVTLDFHPESYPQINISNIRVLNGKAPDPDNNEGNYSLKAINSESTEIYSGSISNPESISETFHDNKIEGKIQEQKEALIVTIPYTESIRKISISDKNGNLQDSVDISLAEYTDKEDNYQTVTPEQAPINKDQKVLGTNKTNPAGTSSSDTLDIVFIGDDFSEANIDAFKNKVAQSISSLLSHRPFSYRGYQIIFRRIDNTSVDLGCTASPGIADFCDNSKIVNAVNNSGVPYDFIHTIVNSPVEGGYFSGKLSVCSGNYPGCFPHETAHSLGACDEYVYDPPKQINNNSCNCYKGNIPNPGWSQFPEAGYFQGCTESAAYRSTENSIMRTSQMDGVLTFNAVTESVINNGMNKYAPSVIAPTIPPSPTLIPLGQPCTENSQCEYEPNSCYGGGTCWGICMKDICDIPSCGKEWSNDKEIHSCTPGLSSGKPEGSNICCPNSSPDCNVYCNIPPSTPTLTPTPSSCAGKACDGEIGPFCCTGYYCSNPNGAGNCIASAGTDCYSTGSGWSISSVTYNADKTVTIKGNFPSSSFCGRQYLNGNVYSMVYARNLSGGTSQSFYLSSNELTLPDPSTIRLQTRDYQSGNYQFEVYYCTDTNLTTAGKCTSSNYKYSTISIGTQPPTAVPTNTPTSIPPAALPQPVLRGGALPGNTQHEVWIDNSNTIYQAGNVVKFRSDGIEPDCGSMVWDSTGNVGDWKEVVNCFATVKAKTCPASSNSSTPGSTSGTYYASANCSVPQGNCSGTWNPQFDTVPVESWKEGSGITNLHLSAPRTIAVQCFKNYGVPPSGTTVRLIGPGFDQTKSVYPNYTSFEVPAAGEYTAVCMENGENCIPNDIFTVFAPPYSPTPTIDPSLADIEVVDYHFNSTPVYGQDVSTSVTLRNNSPFNLDSYNGYNMYLKFTRDGSIIYKNIVGAPEALKSYTTADVQFNFPANGGWWCMDNPGSCSATWTAGYGQQAWKAEAELTDSDHSPAYEINTSNNSKTIYSSMPTTTPTSSPTPYPAGSWTIKATALCPNGQPASQNTRLYGWTGNTSYLTDIDDGDASASGTHTYVWNKPEGGLYSFACFGMDDGIQRDSNGNPSTGGNIYGNLKPACSSNMSYCTGNPYCNEAGYTADTSLCQTNRNANLNPDGTSYLKEMYCMSGSSYEWLQDNPPPLGIYTIHFTAPPSWCVNPTPTSQFNPGFAPNATNTPAYSASATPSILPSATTTPTVTPYRSPTPTLCFSPGTGCDPNDYLTNHGCCTNLICDYAGGGGATGYECAFPQASPTPTRIPTFTPTRTPAVPSPTNSCLYPGDSCIYDSDCGCGMICDFAGSGYECTVVSSPTPIKSPTQGAASITPTKTPTKSPTPAGASLTPTRTPTKTVSLTPTRTPTKPASSITPTRTPTPGSNTLPCTYLYGYVINQNTNKGIGGAKVAVNPLRSGTNGCAGTFYDCDPTGSTESGTTDANGYFRVQCKDINNTSPSAYSCLVLSETANASGYADGSKQSSGPSGSVSMSDLYNRKGYNHLAPPPKGTNGECGPFYFYDVPSSGTSSNLKFSAQTEGQGCSDRCITSNPLYQGPGSVSGDADCSGNVDEKDFGLWLSQYNGTDKNKTADFDCSGKTDENDFGIWVNTYSNQ